MTDEKSGSPSAGLTTYQLAERLSKSRHVTNDYVEGLEARIRELEAVQDAGNSSEAASTMSKGNLQWEKNRPGKTEVVILVHGIRDRALWQSQVRSSLRVAGFEVDLTNYGRFDVFRFLIPVPGFRRSVVKDIRDQIRTIKLRHPSSDLSIIAHSFGTYVVSRVMHEEFDIVFKRIVFCGGVFSQRIPFAQFSNRFSPPILNEVGVKDFWPAVANSVTWGFGAPGTFGFRRPLFEDRWHNKTGHSFYLTKAFCEEFWVPFLADGKIVGGEESPNPPHWSVDLISTFHLKYLFICLLLGLAAVIELLRGK